MKVILTKYYTINKNANASSVFSRKTTLNFDLIKFWSCLWSSWWICDQVFIVSKDWNKFYLHQWCHMMSPWHLQNQTNVIREEPVGHINKSHRVTYSQLYLSFLIYCTCLCTNQYDLVKKKLVFYFLVWITLASEVQCIFFQTFIIQATDSYRSTYAFSWKLFLRWI